MTSDPDYDPELAARLNDRLNEYALLHPLSPRPPARRRMPVAGAAIAALLAAGIVGLGFGVNAAAESQGAGCLDPVAKIHLVVTTMADAHLGAHQAKTAVEHAEGCHGGEPHDR